MKVYIEMEGKNPKSGLPDVAYVEAQVDDQLVRVANGNPVAFVLEELRQPVEELLKTVGVL